jgi:hypothetical protein
MSDSKDPPAPDDEKLRWLKRAGLLGFLFFFVKGLLWILIPLLMVGWTQQ